MNEKYQQKLEAALAYLRNHSKRGYVCDLKDPWERWSTHLRSAPPPAKKIRSVK